MTKGMTEMTLGKTKAFLLGATALIPAIAVAQTTPPPAPSSPAPEQAPAVPVAEATQEIVVTAQKRSESVQRVPISILAFNGPALDQAGIFTPADLQRIAPTFRSTSSVGTLATRFSIRGIGSFSNSAIEPSVATFINGIYVPRPASIVNSLLDIEAVEVLSGPQGTLFGRNASVGAVSYRTTTPGPDFAVGVKTDYSTGAHSRTEGYVNIPLSDTVSIRVAGLADAFGGYWINDITGRRFGGIDTYQGRVSLKAKLTPNLIWNLRGDYQENSGDGVINANLIPSTLTPTTLARLTAELGGGPINTNQYSRHNYQAIDNAIVRDNYGSVSSDLAYTTDGDFTVRLLDGYNAWNSPQSDGDSAQLSVYVLGRDLHYKSKSNSHELQFISPKDKLLDGKLDFVGGLYYFHETLGISAASLNGPAFCTTLVPLAGLPFGGPLIPGVGTAAKIATCQGYTGPSSIGTFDQSTRSLAAYGQATFKLLPTLDLTGGVRYTDEKKGGSYVGVVNNPTGVIIAANENTALALKDHRFTWRANLSWRPTRDVMLFASASTGFKSGGFNNGVATAVLGQNRIFQAETVKNYEVGVKSQLFDRMLTVNATAFRMDVNNFQERSIINLTSAIRNVGSVRQQGVELEGILRPVAHLRLNAAATYIDSKITNYNNAPLPPYCPANLATATAYCPVAAGGVQNLAGARLNYNPRWTGVAGATVDGTFGGSGWRWTLNGDVTFVSSQRMGTTIDNSALLIQPGYALLNGRFTISDPANKWSVGIYGRNLANKGYCSSKVYQVLEGPLGLRYDSNADGVNDGTAVRCLVGAPRVIGATVGLKF